jgi:predicted nucleotidyltransferase
MSIAISPGEEAEIRSILARILPAGTRVFVFGSRAGGNPKRWSDLDLALESKDGPLPLAVLAELAEAFDESALPWKVDLVDRACVTPEFGKIIDAENIPLV